MKLITCFFPYTKRASVYYLLTSDEGKVVRIMETQHL